MMTRKNMEKVLGQWVRIGSKKHKILKYQVKHFEDLRRGSN